MTSSFTHRSPVRALPSRARRTASSAVLAPAVLGRRRTPSRASRRPTCPGALSSTRRTETVTTSAPAARMASRITPKSRYLPEPRMRRLLSSTSPTFQVSI
jgi:hypothetical protein